MADKFYQFHYAEMEGFEVKDIGILNIKTNKSITRQELKAFAQSHLNRPGANIVISHVDRINQDEFERCLSSGSSQ
ncbi:MAG: hypothetical protein IPP72_19890 [Chitinophagaceae bacterium]|nr:hypothetical protein [Chitinophagaceae bacterium]